MIVAVHNVQKTKAGRPNTDWLFEASFVNSAADYDSCWYCPPLMGSMMVRLTVDGVELGNPFQKPQLLYAGLVTRFSPAGSVIAELTAGSFVEPTLRLFFVQSCLEAVALLLVY